MLPALYLIRRVLAGLARSLQVLGSSSQLLTKQKGAAKFVRVKTATDTYEMTIDKCDAQLEIDNEPVWLPHLGEHGSQFVVTGYAKDPKLPRPELLPMNFMHLYYFFVHTPRPLFDRVTKLTKGLGKFRVPSSCDVKAEWKQQITIGKEIVADALDELDKSEGQNGQFSPVEIELSIKLANGQMLYSRLRRLSDEEISNKAELYLKNETEINGCKSGLVKLRAEGRVASEQDLKSAEKKLRHAERRLPPTCMMDTVIANAYSCLPIFMKIENECGGEPQGPNDGETLRLASSVTEADLAFFFMYYPTKDGKETTPMCDPRADFEDRQFPQKSFCAFWQWRHLVEQNLLPKAFNSLPEKLRNRVFGLCFVGRQFKANEQKSNLLEQGKLECLEKIGIDDEHVFGKLLLHWAKESHRAHDAELVPMGQATYPNVGAGS